MSRNGLSLLSQYFPAFRTALNNAIDTLRSSNSGSGRASTPSVGQINHDTDKDRVEFYGTSGWRAIADLHGQCRLAYNAGNVVLSRLNGRFLMINGALEVIPAGGVSLAATGLTPGTLYYIYAYMSGATMTLEPSATTHANDGTTGVEIKSGDATRTLVGMACPVAGPAWSDVAGARLVASWFNRRRTMSFNAFTANRTTTSLTEAAMNSEINSQILAWADELVDLRLEGNWQTTASTGYTRLTLSPGPLYDQVSYGKATVSTTNQPVSCSWSTKPSTEGVQTTGLDAYVLAAATLTFQGNNGTALGRTAVSAITNI
jgi:hypothetical protein